MAQCTIPNMYSANINCMEGLTDFAKSCVATHISEDMDRLTDCVGQCTICRSIPSDLYELHNLATEVLGHDLLQCRTTDLSRY